MTSALRGVYMASLSEGRTIKLLVGFRSSFPEPRRLHIKRLRHALLCLQWFVSRLTSAHVALPLPTYPPICRAFPFENLCCRRHHRGAGVDVVLRTSAPPEFGKSKSSHSDGRSPIKATGHRKGLLWLRELYFSLDIYMQAFTFLCCILSDL